jgi:hypothetical protein
MSTEPDSFYSNPDQSEILSVGVVGIETNAFALIQGVTRILEKPMELKRRGAKHNCSLVARTFWVTFGMNLSQL